MSRNMHKLFFLLHHPLLNALQVKFYPVPIILQWNQTTYKLCYFPQGLLLLSFYRSKFFKQKKNAEPLSPPSSTILSPLHITGTNFSGFQSKLFTWVNAWEDIPSPNESPRHFEVKCPSRQSCMTFWKRAFIEPQIDESFSFKQGNVFYSSCFDWNRLHSFHFFMLSCFI